MLISNSYGQDTLLNGFTNPPSSAKARTWWHWINGNVSKAGITADLEAMKAVGIQEAQIFNVDQGYPDGQATFLSPKWLEMFQFAVTEAERLGLEIGFHNGAGWSSSGGPWITPELAMQTIVFTEIQLAGDRKIQQKLATPATKLNYYKDIAVIAFPTPRSNLRIDNLNIKTLANNAFKTHLPPSETHVDQAALIDPNTIIDLTGNLSADGLLRWTAPAGNWTVIRFGHTPTGAENRPSGLGGKGLEVNKMSSQALEAYWEGGIKPILDKIGPSRRSLVNCLVDSYEVGCNNWTAGFFKEFKARRLYSCLPYLPTLAGYYVQSGEVSERFLWDFRKTIGDLIAENYYGKFRELCHNNGMKFSVEPYGGPFDAFKAGAYGDIAMSEFWMGRKEYSESSKLVASISHLNGNAITGAESFTSLGGWTSHPATMKPTGDFIWTEGVNRFIFHTYVHQPWNIGPGVTFHMYGVEMSRLNTWWQQSQAYMSYVARSQFLLQQGRSFADALVFTGESSPNDGTSRPDIKSLGYDYDQIGPDEFAHLTTRGGRIYSRSGLSYHVLLLPESKWATPELMKKIRELVDAGAIVAGAKPIKSPSLKGYPHCDAVVSKLAEETWTNKVYRPTDFAALARQLSLAPDFSAGQTGADLNFIHRVSGEEDIYFISNPKNEARNELCHFRISGKHPELWNAEKGTADAIPVWKQATDGTIGIPLTLGPNEAVFIVFRAKPGYKNTNHLTALRPALITPPLQPLPDLQILKAEYGTFLPAGMVDVTAVLQAKVASKGFTITADNSLSPSDPAPGSVKTLRIAYKLSGENKYLQLTENEQHEIKVKTEDFKLIRAIYGKFTDEIKSMPPTYRVWDVTQKIMGLITTKNLVFAVNDSTFAATPENGQRRELRLTYSSDGKVSEVSRQAGELVHLEQTTPGPRMAYEHGLPTFISPVGGQLSYTTASGLVKNTVIKKAPAAIALSGPWEVSFPDRRDTVKTKKITVQKLISWSNSTDQDVRYFSGTASYRKQVTLPKELLGSSYSLELDLGSVHVIAEVILNGKNLGVLWAPPFRVLLGSAAHAGINHLEIRVTNLWPNRLIGDAQLPDDVSWGDYVPKAWPAWLEEDAASRKSKRVTFTTWKHWNDKSALLTSGLLGPVVIRVYTHTTLPLK